MTDIFGRQRALGARIRARRREAGVKQAALAAVVGKAQSWVSRLERGAAPLEFSQLEAIAKVLGCNAADLLPPPASSPAPPRWKNRDFVVLSSVHLSEDSAREIIGGAIRERLAAGAQIYPVVSARDADGEMVFATEWKADLTTRADLVEQLTTFMTHQSHRVTGVVGVSISSGALPYLDWVNTQTASD
ncbi:divalent cation tolerance protein CutA [Streptomyces spororaveus]|uniref:divalent cation tolerance protein CutA n=1 Tax=Streptomyces spororaveus TaxID=284039 RepID=UPI0036C01B36